MTPAEIRAILHQALEFFKERKRTRVILTRKDGTSIEGIIVYASDPLMATFGQWEILDGHKNIHRFAIKDIEKAVLYVEKADQPDGDDPNG